MRGQGTAGFDFGLSFRSTIAGSKLFLLPSCPTVPLRLSLNARSPLENVPVLKRSISEIRSDAIRLRSGVTLAAYPCRPAAVRGLRARVVDVVAHFVATDCRPTDVEMLRALRPALATTGGKLVIPSSPYAQTGALWVPTGALRPRRRGSGATLGLLAGVDLAGGCPPR